MRTNIEIQEDLLKEIEKLTQTKSQRQAIERAIAELIRYLKRQEMLTLFGKVKWEGNINAMRAD